MSWTEPAGTRVALYIVCISLYWLPSKHQLVVSWKNSHKSHPLKMHQNAVSKESCDGWSPSHEFYLDQESSLVWCEPAVNKSGAIAAISESFLTQWDKGPHWSKAPHWWLEATIFECKYPVLKLPILQKCAGYSIFSRISCFSTNKTRHSWASQTGATERKKEIPLPVTSGSGTSKPSINSFVGNLDRRT